MKCFDEIYPFTTEYIDSYFNLLDLNDKDVLTVGSSLDQAFNAMIFGARNVDVIDINTNVLNYLKLKKEILLNSRYDNFYKNVLAEFNLSDNRKSEIFSFNELKKMNTYMKNEENFEKLKSILKKKEINVINGDIFNIKESITKKYDRVIFSNILQYLDDFSKINNYQNREFEFLNKNYEIWKSILNKEGILQLIYYYGFDKYLFRNDNKISIMNYNKVKKCLNNEILLDVISLPNNKKDAIVTYKKK